MKTGRKRVEREKIETEKNMERKSGWPLFLGMTTMYAAGSNATPKTTTKKGKSVFSLIFLPFNVRQQTCTSFSPIFQQRNYYVASVRVDTEREGVGEWRLEPKMLT
jgi:hypothetical protein